MTGLVSKVTIPAVVTLNEVLIRAIGWSPNCELRMELVFKVGDGVQIHCENIEDMIQVLRAYVNSQPVKF